MKKKISFLISCLLILNSTGAVFAEDNSAEADTAQEITQTVQENAQTAEEDQTDATDKKSDTEAENAVNLYVDRSKVGEANTYANLSAAISAADSIDKSKNQVIITVAGDTYDLNDTITFKSTNGGSSEYPLIIKAEDGKQVIFEAGKRMSGTKITNKDKQYSRFPNSSKNHIFKIDMSTSNIDLGSIVAGYPNMASSNASGYGGLVELVYDGEVMTEARYPNIGTVKTAENVNSGSSAVSFTTDINEAASWKFDENTRFLAVESSGYLFVGGTVTGYDAATKKFSWSTNRAGGGTIPTGTRVSFRNAPEFLDQPGEYYIDVTSKAIYFYPPDETFSHETRLVSMKQPIVKFDKAKNIVLDGITFQNGNETGIVFDESDNCALKNCTVKNISGSGIKVNTSSNIKINSTTIHDIGLAAIQLTDGGNYKNLVSSGNVIENCDIYSVGRLSQVSGRGIGISYETGTVVRNNRIHDVTHEGIVLERGTICTVENNEIYDCVNDTYDAGAIYSGGAQARGVGNVYKNNYIHDIRLSEDATGGAVVGLYWDDQIAGQTSVGNIFANNAFGMLIGGGDWNTIKNNIFYKSNASLTYDSRGEGWQKAIDGQNILTTIGSDIGNTNVLWNTTFPYIAKLYEYAKANNVEKLNAPDEATVTDNLIIKTGDFSLADSVKNNALDLSNNYKAAETEEVISFEDPDNFNFNYPSDTKVAQVPDFEYIDFSKIGMTAEKELGKAQLLAPKNGAINVEGNNVVLRWKDSAGANKYRLQISMDKEFEALIYDEIIKGRKVQLDNLKYNKTFYWRVQPIIASKSEQGGAFSDCFEFTTAKSEAKDTKALSKLLSDLGNGWKKVPEGKRAGMYEPGAIDELAETVDEAETILYNSASKMYEVKNVAAKLQSAIKTFDDKMNVDTVDLGGWIKDESNWNLTGENNYFKDGMMFYEKNHNNAVYTGQQLSRGQLLKFKAKFDLAGYQGWGFNQEHERAYFWASTGYSIVIKRDVFEVQKRVKANGTVLTSIPKTFANEESICTSGVWYTVETGVLSTVMGPRIIVKIDGKTVVDYVDTEELTCDELGYFSFHDASGSTGTYLAPADYTE